MRGIIINKGEEDFYIMYAVEGDEGDSVDFKKIGISEKEEFLDLPSGTVVDFKTTTHNFGDTEKTFKVAHISNIL